MEPSHLADVVLAAALLISAATDLRSRTIYNAVTYPCLVAGPVIHLYLFGTGGLWSLAAAAGFALLVLVPLLWVGGIAFGDVKLLLAVALLRGWPFIAEAMMYTALAGGVLAVIHVIRRGTGRRVLGRMGKMVSSPRRFAKEAEEEAVEDDYLPYGVAIAAGTFFALGRAWGIL